MKFRPSNATRFPGFVSASAAVCTGRWMILLLLCAVFCFGTRGTGLNTQTGLAFSHGAPSSHFAIGDFDGDDRPDLATVETGFIGASRARYWIGFRMGAGSRQMIGVNGPVGGLEIASRDVNGDNIVDLVVSAAWLKAPVAVLVNDGHGNFTVRDPAAFSQALPNPSHTFDSPNRPNPDTAVAMASRSSNDFIASDRIAARADLSERVFTSNSVRDVFPLAVRSSGRAPPLSVHHV